ncbi:MAG TPA: OsmC family protein [Bacteroidia bacterium]|jgi:organic hydroperoxide reductase OsmC/OhrA|nr:OsmC family protein [Bacteroidia bacterium]
MAKEHHYKANVTWTGNKGEGTKDYKAYERNYTISIENKPDMYGSADTPFRGDGTKYNPEDLLLTSLSVCHMLWFLHFCADNGIIVTAYTDKPTGTMIENTGGGGRFTEVTLHPVVTITDNTQIEKANSLHAEANKKCFIANSCNFPVKHVPVCKT